MFVFRPARNGALITVNNKECVNFGTFNFLGVSHGYPEVVASATKVGRAHTIPDVCKIAFNVKVHSCECTTNSLECIDQPILH